MKYEGRGDSEQILHSAVSQLQLWYEKKQTLDDCVENIRKEENAHGRAVVSILFEYFRHKTFLDELLIRTASRGTMRPYIRYVALCALTQALFQNSIAAESAVNVAVDYVKHSKHRAASGFLNAILRNSLKNAGKPPYPSPLPREIAVRWKKNFPAEFKALEQLHQSFQPRLSFRLRSAGLPEEFTGFVQAIPSETADSPFHFFETEQADALIHSSLFTDGAIYIQDPATAASVSLCRGLVRGRVLDACAAPGGKTIMLYDISEPGTRLYAADKSARRIENMTQNFKRTNLSSRVKTLVLDALNPVSESLGNELFDLIFLDAPCSNTGVARRRPDVLCRFDSTRLREVVQLQKQILKSMAPLVKPGGHLLYSTCSIEPEEDQLQAGTFLAAHPEFERIDERLLLPSELHDGAFAVLFRKRLSV